MRVWRVLLDEHQSPAAAASPVRRPHAALYSLLALGIAVMIAGIVWFRPWTPGVLTPPPDATSTPQSKRASIAVLPFDNLSNDPEQEYFVDGITEDIITDLSMLGELAVIARNSTFVYKGIQRDARQIGVELGVQYLVEGSIRKVEDRIRVNAQLIDAATATHLWAERFDEELTDVFVVQDRVIRRIVDALSLTLSPTQDEKLTQPYTRSSQAYDQFLKGQDAFLHFMTDRFGEARAHFRKAIDLDPDFARAYSAVSATYSNEVQQGVAGDPQRTLQQAIDLARTAIALDAELPQAYFVLGYAYLFTFEQQRAIEAVKKAIELSPSYADAYMLLAFIYIHTDRTRDAFRLIDEGMRLNPNYPAEYLGILAHANYWAGNIEASVENYEQVTARTPTYILMRINYAAVLSRAGLADEAAWQAQEVLSLNPEFSVADWISQRPFTNPNHSRQLAEDLRRAGLPE